MKKENIPFSFGENWLKFIETLDKERYEQAKGSLCGLLGLSSLKGKTFLDIGCGSGIFSLAAVELEADRVQSIDVDPKSIEATGKIADKIKEKTKINNWQVEEASVLDKKNINDLGCFDIVYSWGVLHHTGNMRQAITNAAGLVGPKGLLAIAIYNRTKTSGFWLKFKRLYNKSGPGVKSILVWSILVPRVIVRLIKLKHPLKEKRGMSIYYDAVDWAGGLPYEYASFQEICSYVEQKGFKLVDGRKTTGIGCNEFVFKRKAN